MAIELDVIPNSSDTICWHRVISLTKNVASEGDTIPWNLQLNDLQSKVQVDELKSLDCPGYYYCTSDEGSTLAFALEPTVGGEEDLSYLTYFGRNLASTEVSEIFEHWMSAGVLISIASGGGRPQRELETLIDLAIAVAQLTFGYVVVKDSTIHGVPVGIYRPDQIINLREKDAGSKS